MILSEDYANAFLFFVVDINSFEDFFSPVSVARRRDEES